jgi:hypothetical protein
MFDTWHGVITAGMKGMTPQQPLKTKSQSQERTMLFNRLKHVVGTGGEKAASW